MAESKMPWGDLVLIGGIGGIAYFMKDTILSLVGKTGGTSDLPVCTAADITAGNPCRVASPFPYLPNVPVVPDTLIYQNPILCALGVKAYCPPETVPAPVGLPTGCYSPNNWGTGPAWGSPDGNYVEQADGTWCRA